MGLIFMPLLLGALIIGIIAIIKCVKMFMSDIIGINEIAYGCLTSITIFSVIALVYKIKGDAWGLSPFFRLPIYMVFIPFVIYLITTNSKNLDIKYLSEILLISISFSVIISIIFPNFFFRIVHYLGIKIHY